MGNTIQIKKCCFEDIQNYIRYTQIDTINTQKCILIHTFEQDLKCMIKNTISANKETVIINDLIKNNKLDTVIFIYGLNTNDPKLIEKYTKLISFGFTNIYVYIGGLFEWICLQDIYGENEFPTTTKELDILKYRPKNINSGILKHKLQNTHYIQDNSQSNGFLSTLKNFML